MSSIDIAYAVLFAMSSTVAITQILKSKKDNLTLRKDLSQSYNAQYELHYRMTTERVIREREFDDNFCRTCKAVVRPAGHFCYSCGMAYPLKKEKA